MVSIGSPTESALRILLPPTPPWYNHCERKDVIYMSIHEQAMSLLKVIYQRCKCTRAYDVDIETYRALSRVDRFNLENSISYLQSMNYVAPVAVCSNNPISVAITANGARVIEGVPDAQASTNIVYGDNYGITGNNATGNTISNGASFEDIRILISSHFTNVQEQKELIEALKPLYDRMEINAPIEKGMLSHIADKLQSFQPLLSAIISSVTTFLTTPK